MHFLAPADARSWIEVEPDSHFPIQNLPFGVIDRRGRRVATRLGDTVIDLVELADAGLLALAARDSVDAAALSLRPRLFELFLEDASALRDNAALRARALTPASTARMALPMPVRAFVDFYSGINHASNVGKMFRPDSPPLLPNYRWLPVGYNGRASSVIVSGQRVRRPWGQTKGADDPAPVFAPTRELDFELEMGFFLSGGSTIGEVVPIERAEELMAGFVLVNDWSARDVQRWEYQPLGPFLAKSFATSISPWIVSLDALEPFRVAGMAQDPPALPHLRPGPHGHFDIRLEVSLKTAKMTRRQRISATNFRELYWSPAQQLAHQSSNGTPLEAGDLYASGTISGTEPGTYGSMLELTWRGSQPIRMDETGEERRFLEDGDEVTFTGYCQGDGFRVGFGEVTATVLPAHLG